MAINRAQASPVMFSRLAFVSWVIALPLSVYNGHVAGDWEWLHMWIILTAFAVVMAITTAGLKDPSDGNSGGVS